MHYSKVARGYWDIWMHVCNKNHMKCCAGIDNFLLPKLSILLAGVCFSRGFLLKMMAGAAVAQG